MPSIEKYAGPGAWNGSFYLVYRQSTILVSWNEIVHVLDPDMLIVGTKTMHGGSGITVAEARAHFSLWYVCFACLL